MDWLVAYCEKLDQHFDEEERSILKACESAEEALLSIDRLFLMDLRNEWGMWDPNSELHQHFAKHDITFGDHICAVLIYAYWDWLNGREVTIS